MNKCDTIPSRIIFYHEYIDRWLHIWKILPVESEKITLMDGVSHQAEQLAFFSFILFFYPYRCPIVG